ncbi:MAG TPA: SDR family NAD(P)-dependent oxidoreductase [Planctomycetota bacterium]|nr:SDR family NAD(P)-dependent oxidoreductase [Planctomycetota bacterium]
MNAVTDLAGKTAIVTGGSGALGAAICHALARDGAKIAWNYARSDERAHALSAELSKKDVPHLSRKVDGTDPKGMQSFVEEVEKTLGPVEVLVNCAGITQVMPFALMELEDWDLLMGTNLRSMFVATKAVVRGMIRRKSGRIVNVGSIGGERILDVPVHYAACKAAISGFSRALSKELCRHKILVNCVAPGLLDEGVGKNLSREKLEDYVSHCNAGRPGTCQEIAELVAFLCSGRCGYISGQTILADGGL